MVMAAILPFSHDLGLYYFEVRAVQRGQVLHFASEFRGIALKAYFGIEAEPIPYTWGERCYRLPLFVGELDRIELAPGPQRSFFRLCFEGIPLIERASPHEQFLEPTVSALFAKKLSDVVKIIGQEFASEVQSEGLAEIELSLVWYLEVLVAVANVVWQFVQIIAEFGVVINLAGVRTQKRFMFVSAASGHEFEGLVYVSKADEQSFLSYGAVPV